MMESRTTFYIMKAISRGGSGPQVRTPRPRQVPLTWTTAEGLSQTITSSKLGVTREPGKNKNSKGNIPK